jgi:hypothetical protein
MSVACWKHGRQSVRRNVVLPDRVINDGYVLVGDGSVRAAASGAVPAGEKYGGPGFLVLPLSRPRHGTGARLVR